MPPAENYVSFFFLSTDGSATGRTSPMGYDAITQNKKTLQKQHGTPTILLQVKSPVIQFFF